MRLSAHQPLQLVSTYLVDIGKMPLQCKPTTFNLSANRFTACLSSPRAISNGKSVLEGGMSNMAAKAFARCSTDGDAQGVLLCANARALLRSKRIWHNSCAKVYRLPPRDEFRTSSRLIRIVGRKSPPANATPLGPRSPKLTSLTRTPSITSILSRCVIDASGSGSISSRTSRASA